MAFNSAFKGLRVKKTYPVAQSYVRGLSLQLLPMFLAPYLSATSRRRRQFSTAHFYVYIQGVPLSTKPGSSLIILTPMTILQRDLNRSTFVVWEMKRNVSVERLTVGTRSSGPPASQPVSYLTRLSAVLSVIWLRVPTQYGCCSWVLE
jgi:hypothetical protein